MSKGLNNMQRSRLVGLRFPLPTSHFPLLLAGLLLAACAPKGDELYSRAEAALQKGEVRASIVDLKTLVQQEPENAKARALLGRALIESGDTQEGQIEVQKAKGLGAAAQLTLVADCRMLVEQTAFQQVLDECTAQKATDLDKADVLALRAQALLGLGRNDEALKEFQAATALEPENLDAIIGIANAELRLHGIDAALAALDKAPSVSRERSKYWLARGSLEAAGNKLPAAEESFNKASELAVKGSGLTERLPALAALAETQLQQGKTKEAAATSDRLLKSAPKSPYAQMLAGRIAAAQKDYPKARTLLEEAASRDPDNMQARLLLGMVNMELGNLGQAEMHFANVVARQPNNSQAQALLAQVRAQLGSPAESLEGLRAELDKTDADPQLLALAGRLSLATGDREQAMSYLSKASAAGGGVSANTQVDIANSYLMAGDIDKAIEVLESMPADDQQGIRRDYLLMMALMRKGDREKALAQADELAKRSPNDPNALNLAAAVKAAAGKPDEARVLVQQALKLKPDDTNSLMNLARLDLSQGRNKEAKAGFEKVLKGDPTNLTATVALASVAVAEKNKPEIEKWLKKAVADHPESAEAVLALAQFYVSDNNAAKAREVVDASVKARPNDAALANARGLVMLGARDMKAAIDSFAIATRLAPEANGYALNLARAQLMNKDIDGSLARIDEILKRSPEFLPAMAFGASASLQAGKTEKAAGYIELLRRVSPDSAGTLALEGDLAMAQRRYKDALDQYAKAAARQPSRQLAMAQFNAGRRAELATPQQPLRDWLASNPRDTEVRTALAEFERDKGDVAAAKKLYEEGLAVAPTDAILLNNFAALLDAQGDARAADYAARAYAEAPSLAAIQDTYGWILVKQGKLDKGLELLRSADKALPNVPEVQYHLAYALARKGEKSEATDIARKVVGAKNVPAQVKADATRLLADLEKQK